MPIQNFRLPMHSVIPSVSPIMSSKQDFVKVQDQLQFYSLIISSCILFFLFRLGLLSVNLVRRGSTQNDICCHGGGERRIQYQNLKFLSFNILPSVEYPLFLNKNFIHIVYSKYMIQKNKNHTSNQTTKSSVFI